jgi:hypothetical protein
MPLSGAYRRLFGKDTHHMITISTPRIKRVLSGKIERILVIYGADAQLPDDNYWLTRPPDERIAAVIATIGVTDGVQPTLDMLEFVEYLNRHQVRYLVIDGYALGFHGHPRFTKDLDIWVDRTPENAQKLAFALTDFDLSFSEGGLETFVGGKPMRIGRPPNLIDIVGIPDGVTFDVCYENRETTTFEGLTIDFISKEHLIQNKRATGRLRDLADVEDLQGT